MESMRRRRQIVLVLLVVGLLGGTYLCVSDVIWQRRRTAAATAALPEVRAFLASKPEYNSIEVTVQKTEDTGPGLWFSGMLATEAESDRLEADLNRRYGSSDFAVIYVVMWRK
jgi:hypothetical protein